MLNSSYDVETIKAVIQEIRTAVFSHKTGDIRDDIANHLERMLNPRIVSPALTREGDVWLVEVGGRRRIAYKADSSPLPWVVYDEPDGDISLDGTWMSDAEIDRLISLIYSTNDIEIPDNAPLVGSKWNDGMALDRAVPVGTVVKDEDGDVGWKAFEGDWTGDAFYPGFGGKELGHTWTILYLGE